MRYLIPIATKDDLFPREEFHFPKPLVEVGGTPMIRLVVESIKARDPSARFVFVILRQDAIEFSLDSVVRLLAGNGTVVLQLAQPTMGAVCSSLMAVDHIADDEPLVICNGDQVIEADLAAIGRHFIEGGYDGGVVTFDSVHPRWSYVREDADGNVVEAAEKRVLSRKAIAGYYYFRTGQTFVEAATGHVLRTDPVGGRYFISPVLNELILGGGRVGQYCIRPECYISFYSPQRVEFYLANHRSHRPSPSGKLQIVIPMAGRGSRFSDAGYVKPKPFIDVMGRTMIEQVIDNLEIADSRFILIARHEHLEAEPEATRALMARGNVEFVRIDFVTEGAACTVLTARPHLDPNAPLLIANCDQLVDFACDDFINDARTRDLDGSVLCFQDRDRDPKWSFVRVGRDGMVEEALEKIPISDIATVGLYYFKRASDFMDAAADMIAHNDRCNGEFYVCPVYNYVLRTAPKVGVYFVEPGAMHGIGTPADLRAYLQRKC